MAITPQTELRLLKCPLEVDNLNQIKFSSTTAQYNYFNSLEKIMVDNFTYQRKDNIIRFPSHIDDIINYNYVMYQNEAYSNKWFYAFITNMEYINDNMTYITIKTDVYQTWQFQMIWKKSFVEREHVNDDTIGTHTVPENLELGEYTLYKTKSGYSNLSVAHVVVGTTANIINGKDVAGDNYGGIYSGLKYYLIKDVNSVQNVLENMASLGKSSAITTIFLAPDELTGYNSGSWTTSTVDAGTINWKNISSLSSTELNDYVITRPSDLDGYTPKNNKLLTFPYQYFIMSNNVGENAIYHYEDFNFTNNYLTFKVYGSITPGCSIRAVPYKYKNQTGSGASNYNVSWNEGISIGKFPQCSWNTDTYTNWLTQNGINIGISTTSSALQVVGGLGLVASGVGASAGASQIASGITGVASTVGQIHQHALIPPQAEGNINNGDITYSKGFLKLESYPVQIKKEYATIIDNYFSMYGYKVNLLKIPNITGRANWNYIKTIGANIEGNIPQIHIEELKNIFNNGVTIWHNASHFLDYSQSNSIV